ncbi:DNA-binding protein [Achromobacter insuavis]|uniref:DNA-binding protein n=1 Tax=Achromobacter insuavis TaxID=1287735 RepID=UPI001FD24F28|nr:DNA-binding protein [Achromobacter insuavis]
MSLKMHDSSVAKVTLPKLYVDYRGTEALARRWFEQSDWFCHIAEFDPKTGAAMPQSLSSVLAKIARYAPPGPGEPPRDRLWRIAEHSRAALERLFRALNESPRREQALLPVHAVRELDATSFIKLSNRPGRNIREKLAGNPYLQAVRRFQSVDLPENRLVKAFALRLAELLELRRDYLGHEDELLPAIHTWLRSGDAQGIARWDNLPPNNTLLAHRDYRRVWDAWRWLQSLDEDVARDLAQRDLRDKTMRLWKQCAQMWADGKYFFAQMPLRFDYEKFEILPWPSHPPLFKETKQTLSRQLQIDEVVEPVCVDLTLLRPHYATARSTAVQSLRANLLWQHWKRDDDAIDIALFDADAAYLHPDANTMSSSDLFFAKDNTSAQFDAAARAFASRLRGAFQHDTLVWLVPDFLNDFSLEVIRRNLNARFPEAEPLPRSVAAAFEKVDYAKIRDGFPIVVIDTIGGTTSVTKLIAKFDRELKKKVPETQGFYWERHPPIVLASPAADDATTPTYDIPTVDADGQWCSAMRPARPAFIDVASLKDDPRIGAFAFPIKLIDSPVSGAVRLHELQQRAGNLPLWRDQIPELSIKVMKDGRPQRFHLVSRGTTVKPIRGQAVRIDVDEDFTLPAGRLSYTFPLFMGENADNLGFSASLHSSAFPLQHTVVCRLDLTFEYGADNPYQLVFTPLCQSFPPVRATWCRPEERIVDDAPAPEYPAPMPWSDLRRMPKQSGDETADLLEWVQKAIMRLDQEIVHRPKPRAIGVISREWHADKNGAHFTFATCDATTKSVFIHEKGFVRGVDYADFTTGQTISFELQEREGKYSGAKVAASGYTETARVKDFDEASARRVMESIRKGLYFPIIQVWRDGRSIRDAECPGDFAGAMTGNIAYLAALLEEDDLPEMVANEIRFLLSCMHKDAADACVEWITEQVDYGNIRHKQAVGFALGDVSTPWQIALLSKLVARPTGDVLRVLAYAIWREQHLLEKLSCVELKSVLNTLETLLGSIKPCPPTKGRRAVVNWARATKEPLELLLGLLRTRASADSEIKMLLQPHQKRTRELAKQVERVTEIVARSNVGLFSRVQIRLQKPAGDRTPDLLYALRLYLTGDDGANTIHISGVTDSESD